MTEINELAKALNLFQAEVVTVGKEADNPFFKSKYADLGSIMKAALPILSKHGLSVVQLPSNIDGQPSLTTIVLHSSGQSLEATVPLLIDKNNSQGLGSAITYTRRYAFAAALQIVIDYDDDGNKASTSFATTRPDGKPKAFDAPLKGMATDKQRQTIKDNLDKAGISSGEQPGYLIEQYGIEIPLTKEGASFVIDDLFESNSYSSWPS